MGFLPEIGEPWPPWWRHYIWFVTDLVALFISSLVKIGWKMTKLLPLHAMNGLFPPVINEPWPLWWRHFDVIKYSSSLIICQQSYQVWWSSDVNWWSYQAKKSKMSQKRANRVYVLGCNFRSGWNFDMGLSSMENWDDSLSWCVRSNSTYLHSKGVKNARKHKLSKISSVINGPWRQWWRNDDVIEWNSSLTSWHHSYQVWWRSDEKRSSYYAFNPKMG